MIVDLLASPAVAGFSVSKIRGQGPADPGKRALYDPPSGQHVEPGQVVTAFDDFHDQVQHGAGPGHEAACVAGVGPDETDGAEPGPQRAQQAQPGVAVLDGGNGDHDGQ